MNPPKTELYWYIVASPQEVGQGVRTGDTKKDVVYWDDAGRHGGGWDRDAHYATGYFSRKEALTAAMLLTTREPKYIGKLRIKLIRRVWNPCPPPENAK